MPRVVMVVLGGLALGCRAGDTGARLPLTPPPSAPTQTPTAPPVSAAARPDCPRRPVSTFSYTVEEAALPDETTVRALAVRDRRIWILAPDTLMRHDGRHASHQIALCGGENKEGVGSGYSFVAADDRGALAVGTTGTRMLVSRVDQDGQLHCIESVGTYPASAISEDGVWLVRTKTGAELGDEFGWRSAELGLPLDAVVHGVARRGYALAHSLRFKAPWTVYRFDGRSWLPTRLPVMFSYAWISERGVVFATSTPLVSDMVGRATAPTGAPCEVVARIERETIRYMSLPSEFRASAIVGRDETDLWVTGRSNVLHWDGTTWREAAPPLPASGGVVDEDGAFSFVGPRSTTGWPHVALYRVRRK